LQLHAEVPVAMTDIVSANPAVAGTSPLWFGVMSLSHAGMPVSRRLAWYALDVERPAIDVPGLREGLYKLRVERRLLFDRESRPYFGDLAEVADPWRGSSRPGSSGYRGLLREMSIVGTVAIGPNVVNDGSVVMSEGSMSELFGPWWVIAVFHRRSADAGLGSDGCARRPQQGDGWPRRGNHTRRIRKSREELLVARNTGRYITDLGFVMGLMIGMVFIYYAQYQIIRFYLPEYAILKSLGFDWWFFLCMIGQIGAAIITPPSLSPSPWRA